MRRAFPFLVILSIACGPSFYQAPPSLGTYPDRVAAKRWHHLFTETSPLDPALPTAAALDDTCKALPALIAPMDPAKRMIEIDRLLGENRTGPYSSRRANFLHELRELAADTTLLSAAGTYIEWRVNHDSVLPSAPPSVRPWDMEVPEFETLQQLHEFRVKQRLTFFKEQINQSDGRMLPYWIVRRGAFHFESGRYDDAMRDLSLARDEFPDHPRAEAATLLQARCHIEQSRFLRRSAPAEGKAEQISSLLDQADSLLREFIIQQPKGRFTPDAEGWLGGIAFDREQLGLAVKHQLARLDLQPTREITRSVLRECDRIFERLLESQEDGGPDVWIDPELEFDAAAVAAHPLVARLFVQHCIDPAAQIHLPMWWDDGESGDRATIDFLKRRILNPQPFVRLALHSLGGELLKVNPKPDDLTLTLLAWSATEDGEHEQAVALLDKVQSPSDESMQARSIVLQRLGRHAEAVVAFDRLATAFPQSPLISDLPYRRSVSHFRSGQSGKAILDILPLVYPVPSIPGAELAETEPVLRAHSQLIQWLDSLIQFAPLEQLVSAYPDTAPESRQRDILRDAIRCRALSDGKFGLAEAYLTEETQPPAASWEWMNSRLARNLPMKRSDWEQRVAPLAALHAELAASPPASEAGRLHLAIARHWMSQRGQLTLPSLALCYYAASEEEKHELLRRRNALGLGFANEAVHRELDRRDEASHALEHALEAAKSSDPAIAAPALELANQCLFRRAEFSLYQKSRALETDASTLSANLHQQLRDRFPDSPEAKRSVHFTFSPAAGPWMPGDYNPTNSTVALVDALFGYKDDELMEHGGVEQAKIEELDEPFTRIAPDKTFPDLRKEITAAQNELAALRPMTDPGHQVDVVRVIDRLDDLHAAASLPGITMADFISYANGHHDKLPPAFSSLLEFRSHLKPLQSADGWDIGPRNDTIAAWRDFLEKFPDSPKAEAASFRMTRLISRQYRTSRRISAIHFPDAPIPNGYKHVEVMRMDPSDGSEVVLAAISDHEARFPGGRYRDDLNLLRAGALIDSGKFAQALSLLENLLKNEMQRDLHAVAALEFADIAQRLLDPSQRAAVAAAMRRTPGAMDHLRALVDGDTFLSRLKPMMPWLEGQ